ncbi:hypothetical protein H5J25_18415 [Sphingomonas aliaeris]|uniref:DUF4276 family protein n=1 Tax=Sphingomonas aliaeris TaxID=2759526 RepID=A0A974NUE4_9SPHN|nr:DUF4276 family protein [Sphingomonas aliaeris]QQV77254.1 hypothetical protein H5J25_18415 [Sphingomonas aliaeris]
MTVFNTATEDELSECVAVKLVTQVVPGGTIGLKLRKGGAGYLRSSFNKFCQMANREYVLLLTDLDRLICAPELINSWAGGFPLPEKLLFRVPVREIEAWLLADRQGMAALMGISEASLPSQPDDLPDPKGTLLNAARNASRSVRSELVVGRNTLASQGLGYNRVLSNYVETIWNIDRAADRSPSLRRAVDRLTNLP